MDTGLKVYRNYFKIPFGWQCDCKYGKAYPVFRKIVYPGDVFKIHADLLIRYQPMLSPPMNNATATVRFFFVPLRLIEELTELIITGSKDGHLYTEALPEFASVFHDLNVTTHTGIEKHSMLDVLYNMPLLEGLNAPGLLAKLDADKASPAAYFAKAYYRCWWDYYRDENLFTYYTDFDAFWDSNKVRLHWHEPFGVALKKDRITSATPWQLKAIAAPTIEITGSGSITPNFSGSWYNQASADDIASDGAAVYAFESTSKPNVVESSLHNANIIADANLGVLNFLNAPQTGGVSISAGALNAAQFREMMAQTRIFERLARCGSRYTEYLRANFNVSPSDGTLQRAQYLGGFKTHIVTTEVVQTAAAGDNPVGTLRGHGITHGTSTIKPFMSKEIGVIIGILDVKPETIYANGVDRELTARSRFDFFNPSLQHLSEQEVRNGEVYFDKDTDSDGYLKNGQTWGFQPYAQELRTGVKHVCGDMRDSLSYWNQALILSSRPSLNQAFIGSDNHTASYNRPFAVSSAGAYPMIIDFGGVIEAYRPLVRNGTPGFVDHN